jgi:hypothetical protein
VIDISILVTSTLALLLPRVTGTFTILYFQNRIKAGADFKADREISPRQVLRATTIRERSSSNARVQRPARSSQD